MHSFPLTVVLSYLMAVFGLSQSFIWIIQPLILEGSKISVSLFNQYLALGSSLFLLGMPLWWWVKQYIGSKKVLLLSLAFFIVSKLLMLPLLHPGWNISQKKLEYLLLASRIVYGLSASAIVPTSQAWVSTITHTSKTQIFTKLSISLTAGRILGPILSIPTLWIISSGPLDLVIILSIFAGLTIFGLKEKENLDKKSCAINFFTVWDRYCYSLFAVWRLYALAICSQIVFSISYFLLGVWLLNTEKMTAEQTASFIGFLLMTTGILVLFIQFYIIPIVHRYPFILIFIGFICFLIQVLICLKPSIWTISIGLSLVSMYSSLLMPLYLNQAVETANKIPADFISYSISITHTISYSLGGLSSGYLYEYNSLFAYFVCAIFSFFCLVLSHQAIYKSLTQ